MTPRRAISDALRALGDIRQMWNLLSRAPGGKRMFATMVGLNAPYSGSIAPRILRLERGYAQVSMCDHRRLRNHLKSLHAVALVNLGELAAALVLGYSIAPSSRFIPAGLSIDYVKKARGPITAHAECCVPEGPGEHDVLVPVTLRDTAGDTVAHFVMKAMVRPRAGGQPPAQGHPEPVNGVAAPKAGAGGR